MSGSTSRYHGQEPTPSPSPRSRRDNLIEGIVVALSMFILMTLFDPLFPESNFLGPLLALALVMAGLLVARLLRR